MSGRAGRLPSVISGPVLRERSRLVGELRKENYRTAYLMTSSTKAALMVFMAGIEERIGYPQELQFGLLNRFPAGWFGHLWAFGPRKTRLFEEVCSIASLGEKPAAGSRVAGTPAGGRSGRAGRMAPAARRSMPAGRRWRSIRPTSRISAHGPSSASSRSPGTIMIAAGQSGLSADRASAPAPQKSAPPFLRQSTSPRPRRSPTRCARSLRRPCSSGLMAAFPTPPLP